MATITGTLEGITGNAAEEGSVVIALRGYGSQVPRIKGTALLGSVTSSDIDVTSNGSFSEEVAGNDTIDPGGTYYTVTVKDANGDVVQTNAYLFLGDNTYDLDSIGPFDPAQPLPPLPPLIINQLLLIAFSQTPNFPGDQYTAWGIQLTGDVTSSTTSNTVAGNLYTFIISQDATGGHQFVWPPNVFNATPVNTNPSGITIQTFVSLANNGPMLPIGPATYYNQ